MKTLVLGEGAWGCAVAHALSVQSPTTLWCSDATIAQQIAVTGVSSYLPDIQLPNTITPTADISVVANADIIFVTTPVRYLAEVLKQAAIYAKSHQAWILMCKGIDEQGRLPILCAQNALGVSVRCGYLAGPSFARDLVRGAPTALVLAAPDLIDLTSLFPSYIHLSHTTDVVGVQWCAVLKNAMSIALGIADGIGCLENTKAFLFVQAFQEIRSYTLQQGADAATLLTPAGLGDFFMTATSTQGRNFLIGRRIGTGRSVQQVLAEYPHAEGPHTLTTFASQLAHPQQYPILSALLAVMAGAPASSLIDAL